MMDNPLCYDEPHLRFYAGARLLSSDGYPIGTLCVLDHQPRELSKLQSKALITLAKQVQAQLELRSSLRSAESQSKRLKEALDLQRQLVQEVDHRVKNSLQVVASLLRIQSRQPQSAESRDQLQLAMSRVQTIAAMHDHLQGAASATQVDTRLFLTGLVEKLQEVSPPTMRIVSNVASLLLGSARASALGLLVNELVANAIKHGFADEAEGTIEIDFEHDNANAVLRVSDNGQGFASSEWPTGGTGLGMHLVEAMVKQLEGHMHLEPRKTGASVVVGFSL